MDISKSLVSLLSSILRLSLVVMLATFQQATCGQDFGDLTDQNDVNTVTIALTRLDVGDLTANANDHMTDVNDQMPDVNDQILELRWKIKNDLDRDVWICRGVGWGEADDFSYPDYEAYLDEDRTLIIRRRLDVPAIVVYYIWPQGRYIRLRAGEERTEWLSLRLPILHNWLFVPRLDKPGVIHARRLVFELGYHTRDLAQMILDIKESPEDPNTYQEAIVPYLSSLNGGEKVLRVKVDGVDIPYKDVWVGHTATEN
ncbi:MAG: hypothetical protein JSW47_18790 [Phycisphaerales bacterium]|nr:MAG: hypothetical protein JSW47_18790 [Phycisphaerales bacterium]